MAGLKQVPAIVKTVSADRALELSLLENLRRVKMKPLEKARGFRRLCRNQEWSHAKLAERLGLKVSTISNAIRLLTLSADVLVMVASGGLRAGHGRALLGVRDKNKQVELAEQTKREKWSVRALEREVRARVRGSRASEVERRIKARVESKLNAEATFHGSPGKGECVKIAFRGSDGLSRLAGLLEKGDDAERPGSLAWSA